LLLEWDTEQRHSANFVPHDFQEVVNVSSFLHIVGQMKVSVVYEIVAGARAVRVRLSARKGRTTYYRRYD
jgi:hypothetical protein